MGEGLDLDAARRLVSAEERRALEEAEAMRDEAARLLQRAETATRALSDPAGPLEDLEQAKQVEQASGRVEEVDALVAALERLADRFDEALSGLDHLVGVRHQLGELQTLLRSEQEMVPAARPAARADQPPDDGLLQR